MYILKKLDAQEERHKYIVENINSICRNKLADILDLGCGNADLAKLLKEKGYKRIIGVDKKKKVEVKNLKYLNHFSQIDLNNQSLKFKKKFDLVIISEVLEHLNNFYDLLLAVKNLLKKKGLLILTIPNSSNIFQRFHFLLKGFLKRYPVEKKSGSHITVILNENLISILNRLNMKVFKKKGGKVFIKNYCLFSNRYFSNFFSYDTLYIIKKNF